MLEVNINTLRIGKRTLAENMNLELKRGSIRLLKGPNGCGKSLLLDIITGVYKNSGVSVSICGEKIRSKSLFRRWQHGISRMFQAPIFPPELTISQVFAGIGISDKALKNQYPDVIDIFSYCGLDRMSYIDTLSFGQKRIVELAVSLVNGNYCLLDEPFSGLSQALILHAKKLILQFAKSRKAILIIDHFSMMHPDLYDIVYEWNSPRDRIESLPHFSNIEVKHRNFTPIIWEINNFGIGSRGVLKNSQIEMSPNGFLMITGSNGTGKSTLLREMGKFPQPWGGVSSSISEGVKKEKSFFSPQPPKIVGDITVKENLWLMIGRGSPVSHFDRKLVFRVLKWLGFNFELLNVKAYYLSGGESAMIALAGAYLCNADILFLDEPFESLAPEIIDRAIILLNMTLESGKCIVATSHNTNFTDLLSQDQKISLSSETAVSGFWKGKNLNL